MAKMSAKTKLKGLQDKKVVIVTVAVRTRVVKVPAGATSDEILDRHAPTSVPFGWTLSNWHAVEI